MLDDGLSPKTVRNVLTFTHSVFEHAIAKGWCHENPVRYAARPKRRRARDARPDLQFLTVAELDAVLRAIPDEVVHRQPVPTRRGRKGPGPPPPPDVLGPVLRVVTLAAAMTGLRQSELLGLRWRDIDWTAQRIRVRNAFVRQHQEPRPQLPCGNVFASPSSPNAQQHNTRATTTTDPDADDSWEHGRA
jgi:integrase